MITHASLIPLDYTSVRKEYSLRLVADSWRDLRDLIEDPLDFIYHLRLSHKDPASTDPPIDPADQSFPYDPGASVRLPEWGLQAPVTVTIQKISQAGMGGTMAVTNESLVAAEIMYKAAQARGFKPPSDDGTELEVLSTTSLNPTGVPLEHKIKAHAKLAAAYPHGGFYAEMALRTNTITVSYLAATIPVTEQIYYGGVTQATVSLPQFDEPLPYGTLHFDLTQTSADRQSTGVSNFSRASFVLAHLEKPAEILALLIGQSYKRFRPHYIERGTVYFESAPDSNPISGLVVSTSPVPLSSAPSVVIEGLSECPGPVEPCTVYTVIEVGHPSLNHYALDTMIIKTY